MKDKRIWIVIGCILVMGTGVTHYTQYYVKTQATMLEDTAAELSGNLSAVAPDPASAPEIQEGGAEGRMAAEQEAAPGRGRAVPAGGTGSAPSFRSGGTEEAAPAETSAGARDPSGDAQVPQAYEARIAEDEAPAGDVPLSPLTGAGSTDGRPKPSVDYRQRLMDLDGQIQRMGEQGADSNVYSIKTSAETELKMWDSEMNTIYNALLEVLPKEEAAKLASEQREWMKDRDAKVAEGPGKNGVPVEGIGYMATMVSLTRERAYELAGRYEDAYGRQASPGEEPPAAVSGQ